MSHIVGYAPGVYDLFHIGHLNILRHAKSRCDYLVAGVLTDEVAEHKGHPPVVPLVERLEIIRSIRYVDAAIVDTTLDKVKMWPQVRYDRLFKGDDWRDTPLAEKWRRDLAAVGAELVFLPYTMHTSSTKLRQALDTLSAPVTRRVEG